MEAVRGRRRRESHTHVPPWRIGIELPYMEGARQAAEVIFRSRWRDTHRRMGAQEARCVSVDSCQVKCGVSGHT